MDLAKVKSLIEEFVDSKTVNAVLSFAQSDDNSTETINSIAAMFGYSGSFESEDEHKLVQSFKNNLKLLIEKTWVEKSDIALKDKVLLQLDKILKDENSSWISILL